MHRTALLLALVLATPLSAESPAGALHDKTNTSRLRHDLVFDAKTRSLSWADIKPGSEGSCSDRLTRSDRRFFESNEVAVLRIVNRPYLSQYAVRVAGRVVQSDVKPPRGAGEAFNLLPVSKGAEETKAPQRRNPSVTELAKRMFFESEREEVLILLRADRAQLIQDARIAAVTLDTYGTALAGAFNPNAAAPVQRSPNQDPCAPTIADDATELGRKIDCIGHVMFLPGVDEVALMKEARRVGDLLDSGGSFSAKVDDLVEKFGRVREQRDLLTNEFTWFQGLVDRYEHARVLFVAESKRDRSKVEVSFFVNEKLKELKAALGDAVEPMELRAAMKDYEALLERQLQNPDAVGYLGRLKEEIELSKGAMRGSAPGRGGPCREDPSSLKEEDLGVRGLAEAADRLSALRAALDTEFAMLEDGVRCLKKTRHDLLVRAADVLGKLSAKDADRSCGEDLVLGQWDGSAIVEIQIHERPLLLPWLSLANLGSAAPVSGGFQPRSPEPKVRDVTGATVGTLEGFVRVKDSHFEVHESIRWNVIAGFAASSLKERSFAIRNLPRLDANGQPLRDSTGQIVTDPRVVVSGEDQYQPQYLLGVNIYLAKRDLFPNALGPWDRVKPGITFGISLRALQNYFLGLNFEPVNGLDVTLGAHVGRETVLQDGFSVGDVVPSGDPPTRSRTRVGAFASVGFDANIFRSVFGKVVGVSAAETPPAP